MKRRSFVKKSALVSGGLLLAGNSFAKTSFAQQKKTKVTILHTNDTHSNIEPLPANHSKFPNMGGISKRFEVIKAIRQEQEHVLLLDAGDIFQGTPYFNKYKGTLEMKLMSELGYDAATMGNHDFDAGLEGFFMASEHAKFPFLCANYDFSNTILKDKTKPYTIFKKGKYSIGVFGIGIELDGLVPASKFEQTIYLNPIKVANEVASFLKKEGCDVVICLSHLGFEYQTDKVSDRVLAAQTSNIDIILGGHTHTFMEKPTEVNNSEGKPVLINQVGWGGLHLGRIDIEISTEKTLFRKQQHVKVI
jgi:5'-nucleotidase